MKVYAVFGVITAFEDLVNRARNLENGPVAPKLRRQISSWKNEMEEFVFNKQHGQTMEREKATLSRLRTRAKELNFKALFEQTQTGQHFWPRMALLKQAVTVPEEEKFMNYGCYCTPSGAGGNERGEPVDQIDALCRQLYNAYHCLKKDYEQCDPKVPYNWEISDEGKPVCSDNVGTCSGDVCRLDMSFTSQLVGMDHTWAGEFHALNGFDREKSCEQGSVKKSKNISSNDARVLLEDISGVQMNDIGGDAMMEINLSKTACCGEGMKRHLFRLDHLECCADGSTRQFGTCK